ncbi:xyloglucan O-acetyltransferase 1-like [Phragmites australis]|uniref:xyloglucan O-acetyltransferase 1-like n=1 Tax=Phragmites australis TaxID=29695 RepID=UPI002D7724FF|nr:xyloglucan O-acetyltransferase 1-like [Phragmites australis]
MGATTQDVADHGHCSYPRKLLAASLCALFILSIIYFIFYSSTSSLISYADIFAQFQIRQTTSKNTPVPPPQAWLQCDYGDGKWVWDDSVTGPRYDSEHCDMKGTEKCVINGKPDKGYLNWRWQPAGCNLPALDPAEFLRLVRGKRLAFVGDSTVRNQAESLVCFLSTVARPETVHRYEERLGRKFWRWVFPAPHSVNISTYWSPFLVRSEGHSEDYSMKQETVILDALTDPWTADIDAMDIMVISAGHWFPHPAMYYEDGEVVNKTNISYLGVFRKVMRRTLEYVNAKSTGDKLVVVATMAPSHFDPKYSWNHRDACSRTKPYEDAEAEVETADAELRKAVLMEVATAAARRRRWGLRFEVLDVTRMGTMRPDGHPGPYLFPHSYDGRPVPETVANDCLHWCAPGPVDTFNDLLMQMIVAGG